LHKHRLFGQRRSLRRALELLAACSVALAGSLIILQLRW
jgi:hypothetical protein